MTFKIFKSYIKKVVLEGNRVQKRSIVGKVTTKHWFTGTQIASIFIAILITVAAPRGFSNDFSGYIISFLGIFIGLFSSIVISMQDKSISLYQDWSTKTVVEKMRARKVRNYIVQFTGLTSYSILLALVVVILLSATLLSPKFQIDLRRFSFISLEKIEFYNILTGGGVILLYLHRLITLYFLANIFFITIYSTTSYFSYLQSEYKKIKIPQ